MKDFLKLDIKVVVILILVAVFLLDKCSNVFNKDGDKEIIKVGGKKYEVLDRKKETEIQTIEKIVEKPGKTIYLENTVYVNVPSNVPVDTMSILRDFYAKNVFRDTLDLGDSLGYITVIDTIQMNKILHRRFESKVNKITEKETIIVRDLPKNQLFFGFGTTLDQTNVFGSASTGLALKSKKDKIYQLNLGVANGGPNGQLTPFVGVGLMWPLKFGK